jgi:hypothetical protein
MLFLTLSGSFLTLWPIMMASPASGLTIVARILRVVVLPAPLGPIKPSWPTSLRIRGLPLFLWEAS